MRLMKRKFTSTSILVTKTKTALSPLTPARNYSTQVTFLRDRKEILLERSKGSSCPVCLVEEISCSGQSSQLIFTSVYRRFTD